MTVDDAYSRLQLQTQAGELDAKLSEDFPKTYGGLWIEQTPEFRVVVGLTEGSGDAIAPYVTGTALEKLVSVVRSTYSVADLQAWAGLFLGPTDGQSVPAFDLTIDIPGNVIIVISESAEDQALVESALEALSGVVDAGAFSPRVGPLAEENIDIYGGLGLSGGCTSGFSTRTTTGGQRGISTAGHCPNSESYGGHNLPFQAERFQGSQDVQWHSIPSGDTARPWVYDGIAGGSTPYYRVITGTLGRSGQPVGALVCSYGVATHYRCGRIVWKNYAPSYVPSAQATFIVLHNDNGDDIANLGDSGGPWFSGGTAYGIHSGDYNGNDAIYMAINYISALNIAVLTG